MGKQMDRWTNQRKISPFYRTLSPIGAAALPPAMKIKEKVEKGKGTADHLMPLGYLFNRSMYQPTNPPTDRLTHLYKRRSIFVIKKRSIFVIKKHIRLVTIFFQELSKIFNNNNIDHDSNNNEFDDNDEEEEEEEEEDEEDEDGEDEEGNKEEEEEEEEDDDDNNNY